jgi:hypothetical protein
MEDQEKCPKCDWNLTPVCGTLDSSGFHYRCENPDCKILRVHPMNRKDKNQSLEGD